MIYEPLGIVFAIVYLYLYFVMVLFCQVLYLHNFAVTEF